MQQTAQKIAFRRQIQTRLGVMLIVVTTALLSGYGGYQYVTLRASSLASLNRMAESVIARLAENLVEPLWNFDETPMQKVVVSEMGDQSVFAVQVKNNQDRLLIGKGRDPQGQIIDMPEPIAGDFIIRRKDIVRENVQIGAVDLYLTQAFIRADLRRTVRSLAAAIVALDVALLMTLTLIVRRMLIRPLARLLDTANVIAAGDFSQNLRIRQQDEIGALASAFAEMQTKVAEVVRDVKQSAQDMAQRSREMNVVAEQMSNGAAQQASATEEVSASMEQMAASIRQTADNAKLTEQIAMKSAEDAQAGKQAVTEIIKAIEVIAERIFVVQEIAGQTNMLSLNATIEAAKAQEQGKGFAVVASSVRDLARQSRAAADEIRTLVHSCVVLSAQAGDILQRLVPNSEKTAELVQEINAASQEQSHGVEHVNQAVQQLDTVTQQNAATAEQVAVTAGSLSSQANALQHAMAFFTIDGDALPHDHHRESHDRREPALAARCLI